MRDLFEELRRDGVRAIDRMIAEKQQEHIELEFKCKSRPEVAELNRDDKTNLAITLSALANSAGGILLWGVEARPNAEGVDCASRAVPINNVEKFENDIDRMLSETIRPRHDGIRLMSIAGADGAGFVCMLVERSERRPHRAELSINGYFKRVGGNSVQMEHYDLEDAFNRNAVAELKVDAKAVDGGRSSGPQGDELTTNVQIWLENVSNVSARFPYLTFELHRIAANSYAGGADNVIHPGNSMLVATIPIRSPRPMPPPNQATWMDPNRAEIASVSIACTFGCLNARRRWAGFRIFGNRELEVLPIPAEFQ